jgi:hypothetical protein
MIRGPPGHLKVPGTLRSLSHSNIGACAVGGTRGPPDSRIPVLNTFAPIGHGKKVAEKHFHLIGQVVRPKGLSSQSHAGKVSRHSSHGNNACFECLWCKFSLVTLVQ